MSKSKVFLGRALSVVATAALALTAMPARAGDECITPQVKAEVWECPEGVFQASVTKRPQVSFNTAPEEIKLKSKEDMKKPVNPEEITKTADRDQRRERLKPKVKELLLTELANLDSLFKSTPKNSKDRPKLMRRLAEGYVELESSAFLEKTQAEIDAQNLKSSNPDGAGAAKEKARKAGDILKLARGNAIKYYGMLKDKYPQWCQDPNDTDPKKSTGCGDEVLYYLAYEHEQAGEYEKARDVYLELIDNWKESKYIPNAFLAFGELFFQEAQGDPQKWGLAEQAYKNVLKYDPPENKLWGYAQYKLAYVLWNQGKFKDAVVGFKSVIEFGTKYASLPNASGLATSARRDIIPVYALAEDPARAYNDFKPISGDAGAANEKTFKMMEDLGATLLDTGHYPEAIVLYKDLMKRNVGDNYCIYQANIAKATMAMESGNKVRIRGELDEQVKVYTSFLKATHSDKSKLECANETAGLVTETAMAWHLEAVGSGGVRGTGDLKTMQQAAQLYELVVSNFTNEQFKAFKFPRIIKEDWPSVPKIRYAMADLLYFQKDWAKCGPAFDAVVAEDPNGPNAAEAAYASVLCYQNIYATQHADGSDRKGGGNLPGGKEDKKGQKDSEKLKSKEFSKEQQGMVVAFKRYLCHIKPSDTDKDAREQYVEVMFALGRTYFEAYHWEQAAEVFRKVALEYPAMDASVYAANLYLEAANIMGSKLEPARSSCYDIMSQDVPAFTASFCTDAKKKDNEEQCDVLFRVQRDFERLKAEAVVKECDKGADAKSGARTPEALKKCEEGGNLYMELWKKYAKDACEDKKEGCARAEEILYNAARAYQAARLVAKSISVRKLLLDPKYHLEGTDLAKQSVYEIGGNYQAIAVYDLAAEWYEKFAAANPGNDKASDALSDAVVLRLGLGEADQAIRNADTFQKLFANKKAAQAAQIGYAIAEYYAQKEDWNAAYKRLNAVIANIDAQATLDIKMQAHALLGRIGAKTKKGPSADTDYGKVKDSWKDPAKAIETLKAIGGDDSVVARRVGKVLNAVGEALFYFGEKKRLEVEKVKFPEYKGSGEAKDVDKFVKDKVKEWMEKKKPLINEAGREYFQIKELKPDAPPMWVIKGAAAVGKMWGDYVALFRAAPYPKDWNKCEKEKNPTPETTKQCYVPFSLVDPDGDEGPLFAEPLLWIDLRATYLANLDAVSEPEKNIAKKAYAACMDESVKFQYFDEDSRSCEQWLSKNYPGEYHLIDEFRPAPTRANSGLDERSPLLDADGTPLIEDTRALQ